MLEDIRTHSAVPTEQEIAWMNARPARAVLRVAVLGVVAVALANGVPDWANPLGGATLAVALVPANAR